MRNSLFYILGLTGFVLLFTAANSETPSAHSIVVAPSIPGQMSLAGEEVPIGTWGD